MYKSASPQKAEKQISDHGGDTEKTGHVSFKKPVQSRYYCVSNPIYGSCVLFQSFVQLGKFLKGNN